jgi:DNA repair exonuclease SbcCD ATPase subunit
MNNNAGYVEKVQTLSTELEQARQTVAMLTAKLKELSANKDESMQSQAQMENEVREHKSKRLNAKNELQLLLKQNDNLKSNLQKFDETIKFSVIHQLEQYQSSVEDCIRDVNVGVDCVARKMGVNANAGSGEIGRLGGGIEMTEGIGGGGGGSGGKAKESNETLNLLSGELSKVTSGLDLLKSSVDRLNFIADAGKSKGCLESLMEVLGGGGGANAGTQYGALKDDADRISALDDDEDNGEEGQFTIA